VPDLVDANGVAVVDDKTAQARKSLSDTHDAFGGEVRARLELDGLHTIEGKTLGDNGNYAAHRATAWNVTYDTGVDVHVHNSFAYHQNMLKKSQNVSAN
jgi:hypothetical protein